MKGIFINMFKESKNYFKAWFIISLIATCMWLLKFVPFLEWMTTERLFGIILATFVMFPIRGAIYGIAFWAIKIVASTDKSFAAKIVPFIIVNKLGAPAKKDDPNKELDHAILGVGNAIIFSVCFIIAILMVVFSAASAAFITITAQDIWFWVQSLFSNIGKGIFSALVLGMNIYLLFLLLGTLSFTRIDLDKDLKSFVRLHARNFAIIGVQTVVIKSVNCIFFQYDLSKFFWNLCFLIISLLLYGFIFIIVRKALQYVKGLNTQQDSANDSNETIITD
jgi:hypothetical protein